MTVQQPERLSPEREQEIRRIFAVGHHPIGSEVLAELDAVRRERELAVDELNHLSDEHDVDVLAASLWRVEAEALLSQGDAREVAQ